jgi:flagellar basal-body rod protein FlgC
MSLLNVFDIAGSAMTAQALRLNTVASNLANADSATGPDGKPYKALQVEFSAAPIKDGQGVGVKSKLALQHDQQPFNSQMY